MDKYTCTIYLNCKLLGSIWNLVGRTIDKTDSAVLWYTQPVVKSICMGDTVLNALLVCRDHVQIRVLQSQIPPKPHKLGIWASLQRFQCLCFLLLFWWNPGLNVKEICASNVEGTWQMTELNILIAFFPQLQDNVDRRISRKMFCS